MENDLISRSALIDRFKQLKGSDTLANMFVSDVINEVNKQPTAYNVEKVIQQLREQDGTCTGCNHSPDECAWCSVKERLDIVRKGGVEC